MVIEVFTPLGAAMAGGVLPETVRQAAASGGVRTRAVLHLTGRSTRLIDATSAAERWEIDESRLEEARSYPAVVVEADGQRYRILSPHDMPLLDSEPPGAEQWHDKTGGIWPVWFRGS